MAKRMLMAAVVLILSIWVGLGSLTYAEQKVAPDERFEKLAKELYPKALQEGEVVLYSVLEVESMVAFLRGFSEQFPGIKTTYWQATTPQIVYRVTNELQAGQRSVDVIFGTGVIPPLQATGAFMPYEPVQKDALILQNPPNITIPVMQIQALAYNTKKVKAEDLPKSWEDIANPKYKGIVALYDPLNAGPLVEQLAAFKELWKDDVKWTNFVKGLKALNVPVHKSTGGMFRLVVSGEYSIALPANVEDVKTEKAKGSPVDFVKSVPPFLFPMCAGIYVKSPHPNAAKLFAEWLVSPAGQTVICSTGRVANRKGIPCGTSVETIWPSGTKPIAVYPQEYKNDPKKWVDTYVNPIWEAK